MTTDLTGKVVWITGGARGLGRALALGFAAEGAHIAFNFHQSKEEAARVATEVEALGVRCLPRQADLRRVEEIEATARDIDASFDRIDILINNAGVFRRTPIDELSEDDFDETVEVNLKAATFASREAARRMRGQGEGVIINIASVGGLVPWAGYPAYCASKAAVLMATRCLALSLAPAIRVNAVAPGILTLPEDMSPADKERLRKNIPLREFGRYDDVVVAALFLAKSGYITGETLVVDGGRQLI